MDTKKDLLRFESMLEGIDLAKYRDAYRPIKIVEMDMPKNIQAIELLYEIYWKERNFLNFEDFYKRYETAYKQPLEEFRVKTTMCAECFYRGLPARIYRTWASIITQIHGGYVAESVFGAGSVSMSPELDHLGADFRVQYAGVILNYQVKKKTFSREVRRGKESTKVTEGKFVDVMYEVPADEYFKSPLKKDGTERLPYKRFVENKTLRRLSNGFVLFTREAFLPEKLLVDQVSPY